MRRIAIGLAALATTLTAAAFAGGILQPSSAAAMGAPTFVPADAIDPGDLSPCARKHVPPRLRCGKMRLPYEAADPSLGSLPIAFAVRPRLDRSKPSRGAVIAVEGGPGYGSIGSARTYVNLLGERLDHRDLLVVDAPGTGASRALDCRLLQSGRADDDTGVAACARSLGERWHSYRTQVAADNIDTIRKALGYEDVQVYGDSYGTYLAQSYAFRHPDGLSALVLDSAYPVRGESGWYPSVWRTGIRGLSIACRRSTECHGDAGARLARFVKLLRKTKLGVGPLLNRIGAVGYSPPDSYLKLDAAISAYLRGNTAPYERMIAPGRVGYGKPGAYSHGEELAVSCNDYPMIWDKAASYPERQAQLLASVNSYPQDAFAPFTPAEIALSNDVLYRECLGAPVPNALYQPPVTATMPAPDAPTLVVIGELDNVTSPAEGSATAALFPNAETYLFRGGGHVASLYGRNNPGAKRIRAFLKLHG